MDFSLSKPMLERFITDEVKAGHFSSPLEVVEAALARLMLDADFSELDRQDIEDIRISLEQMERGEVIDWKTASAELRKKYPCE